MKRQTATAHALATATPEAIWSLMADVSTWTTWAPFEAATLQRPGSPDRDGVGAIRRFQRGRFTTVEEVTSFVPNERLGYRLLSGLPLRNYEAQITLERMNEQTRITWSSQFESKIPGVGGAFRRGMQKLYGEYAALLAGAASQARNQEPNRRTSS